jgi:hypothetical protein
VQELGWVVLHGGNPTESLAPCKTAGLRSTWIKHQSLAKAKSGFYGALPRNFAGMKSLPGLGGKDLHGQSQYSMKDVGIVIHNQGHEFACNANPSFVSPAGSLPCAAAGRRARVRV